MISPDAYSQRKMAMRNRWGYSSTTTATATSGMSSLSTTIAHPLLAPNEPIPYRNWAPTPTSSAVSYRGSQPLNPSTAQVFGSVPICSTYPNVNLAENPNVPFKRPDPPSYYDAVASLYPVNYPKRRPRNPPSHYHPRQPRPTLDQIRPPLVNSYPAHNSGVPMQHQFQEQTLFQRFPNGTPAPIIFSALPGETVPSAEQLLALSSMVGGRRLTEKRRYVEDREISSTTTSNTISTPMVNDQSSDSGFKHKKFKRNDTATATSASATATSECEQDHSDDESIVPLDLSMSSGMQEERPLDLSCRKEQESSVISSSENRVSAKPAKKILERKQRMSLKPSIHQKEVKVKVGRRKKRKCEQPTRILHVDGGAVRVLEHKTL